MKTPKSVIHGRAIELAEDTGLPEGQAVSVTVEPIPPYGPDTLEALRRAAGSWTDDVEGLARHLEWNRQQRKVNRREMPA
jgi:hypothetical protein